MVSLIDKIFGLVSYDVGIDLGTANTMVLVVGKGIVVREPSVVARHKKSGTILAIGSEAKLMVGKTPESIEALRPLKDGVIADFDAAEAMLSHYVRLVHQDPSSRFKLPRPRVAVGIPSGVTEVERRAVQEAALSAGARQAYLVEEPMAAAIGADLAVEEPEGRMMVDIGGGTTEIAVISLGGIVLGRSLRVAGDELDEAVTSFARMKYGLVIGEATAEQVKIAVGSTFPFEKDKKPLQTVVRGRELESGLPKSLKFSSTEIREALAPTIRLIVQEITDALEETPPELVADILKNGIVLAGGTSQLRGIDRVIAEASKMPVWQVEDPQTAVVRGCAKVLQDPRLLKKVKVSGGLR
ncbi:rod shape-determining protein [Microgenomates group bacterium RIFCSPLOWO2_01_FULL_46_13]|nr:MAG: rod shape-determining protein [Microgenomates group bacterium RIFCSPHIGHO2_01_FULL_45_11]OGV94885.1 MAG: rod shape-determining protein [Microgenomates group bacterium RIFCSPLOWO2_01_FULL_46_13]